MNQKVVIVSGASSGIGKACAERFAALGMQVFGLSRRGSGASGLVEHFPIDVTDDDSVKASIELILKRTGRIDVLINCAGYGLAGAVTETTLEEARSQFDVNFFGSLRLCQAVSPAMQQQRAGLIVNVSSLGGLFGLPFQGLYSASKFALEGMSEALRYELRPFGVDVVAVEPGDVSTEISQKRVRAAMAGSKTSLYRENFSKVLTIIEHDEAQGIAAVQVASLIERIYTSKNRRSKYTCGHFSQIIAVHAKRWLPNALFEWLIARHYVCNSVTSQR